MSFSVEQLRADIAFCMQKDRFHLRRALQKIAPDDAKLAAIAEKIAASRQMADVRRDNIPVPHYEDPLPVLEKRDEIKAAVAAHPVTIICGETGSGKTTQLPKLCLELGRGVYGWIGHTQPRRIAARSVANRLASELDSSIGQRVGYKVRFSDHVGDNTYVKVMTDGILLAEMAHDRFLDGYDTLIIDEAHERSLNIDFILGYLKSILAKRKDLKVIITSATIDPQRFAKHFDNAPIIEVSGRTYPVEVRYRPLDEQDEDMTVYDAIAEAVDELAHIDNGDILVFLPTERDIRETQETLRKRHPPHTEILPLFSRLSTQEQDKIFKSHGGRRIVLATNVAETSLTVPGIRYVIDTGLARISRYSFRTKIQRLPIEAISQASAKQRAGRCGRLSAGVCIRLYAESDLTQRSLFTDPEILRSNLASVILQMLTLGIGDVHTFPFIDKPDDRQISDGYKLLFELGAVDAQDRVTALGKVLAKLPLDPSLGRMLVEANRLGCLHEALVIVSALSVQDPRERPLDAQEKADLAHSRFVEEKSDFLGLLKLWRYVEDKQRHLSSNKMRQLCKQEYLSYLRIREWHDVYQQLKTSVLELAMRMNTEPAEFQSLHCALLTGLLANLGVKGEDAEYMGARQNKFYVFPGSGLAKKPPKWLVAADIVETSRVYARIVAAIEPEWVEKYAAHLIKHHYFEPHWEKNSAQVAGHERVTLYGLTLVQKRRINYGRVDAKLAREIFIRHALVFGELETRAAFFQHNWNLIKELQIIEEKQRRRDMVVDEQRIFDFYDRHLPENIYSGATFEKWLKDQEKANAKPLFMTREDIVGAEINEPDAALFPDQMRVGNYRIPLQYHFSPGDENDGVTATLPLDMLYQFKPADFDKLVPGLLKEKIAELLKSLPKSLRRNFIPVNEFAQTCYAVVVQSEVALLSQLEQHLFKVTGVKVTSQDWKPEQLPPHFFVRFSVVDDAGKVVATGRDLSELQMQLKTKVQKTVTRNVETSFQRDGLQTWDFDELPQQYQVEKNGVPIVYYPGLADKTTAVSIALFTTLHEAEKETAQGLLRLFLLSLAQPVKYLQKNIAHIDFLCLRYAQIGACDDLKSDIVHAVAKQVFIEDQKPVRNRAEFTQRLEQGRTQLVTAANKLTDNLKSAFTEYGVVTEELRKLSAPAFQANVADIQQQLQNLFYKGFVQQTPAMYLSYYPRYLKAIQKRILKLKQDPRKDMGIANSIASLWASYLKLQDKPEIDEQRLRKLRWMLEELRVSLFAQELKTVEPVSLKRVAESIDALKAGVKR